jgi:hypothetical protein
MLVAVIIDENKALGPEDADDAEEVVDSVPS